MTSEELEKLKAIEAATTPGPWRVWELVSRTNDKDVPYVENGRKVEDPDDKWAKFEWDVYQVEYPEDYRDRMVGNGFQPKSFVAERYKADVDFVVAFRNNARALIDAASRTQAAEARVRGLEEAIIYANGLTRKAAIEVSSTAPLLEAPRLSNAVLDASLLLNEVLQGEPLDKAIAATEQRQKRTGRKKKCQWDTNGDGDCLVHPQGCP